MISEENPNINPFNIGQNVMPRWSHPNGHFRIGDVLKVDRLGQCQCGCGLFTIGLEGIKTNLEYASCYITGKVFKNVDMYIACQWLAASTKRFPVLPAEEVVKRLGVPSSN